jgi:uncharacterized protein YjhX (UPF0386 family)
MKGSKLAVLVGSVALLAAGAAYGIDLGGSVQNAAKDATQEGSKIAVEKEMNKDLASKNCTFTPKTTDLSCDLNEILNTLKEQKTIAEKSGYSKDVDIFVKIGQGKDAKNPSLGSDRSSKVRTELIKKVSWWDWYDTSIDGDQLELSVKIH